MAVDAFELTEKFQTPIFVMTDLDLGMNNWMSDTFKYPTPNSIAARFFRRKIWIEWQILNAIAMSMGTAFLIARCREPTIAAAAYFTRGSGHNEKALYSEKAGRLQKQHGSSGEEVRHGARICAAAGSSIRQGRQRLVFSLSAPRTGRYIESQDQLKR
jgi:2-oxoglutarate ferredoxin oxidoreductase subunit alpha